MDFPQRQWRTTEGFQVGEADDQVWVFRRLALIAIENGIGRGGQERTSPGLLSPGEALATGRHLGSEERPQFCHLAAE